MWPLLLNTCEGNTIMMYMDYFFHIDDRGNSIQFDRELDVSELIEDGAKFKAQVNKDGRLTLVKEHAE